jgi:hypothetical protein
MTDRPILFSAPMVCALLEGRKSQTRRVAKLTDNGHVKEPGGHRRWHPDDPDATLACPYGQPGDRLWVRETWAPQVGCELSAERWTRGINTSGPKPVLHFAADGAEKPWVSRWRPSIHMPRWASRITLEIASVRLERLQAISDADSRAEGAVGHPDGPWHAFRALWTLINGAESWQANPRVWAVEFRRVQSPA